jgi:NAD(P)-dependent dehydrogenase (short-subunit alcohol dehydrogenase family)
MELNFDAVVRSPRRCCRAAAPRPSAIVNVASTAGRVRPGRTGAYSASKFALVGWTDALYSEERRTACTSAWCCPASSPPRASRRRAARSGADPLARLQAGEVAEAIVDDGPGRQGRALRAAPYALAAVARILAPRPGSAACLSGGAASSLTTSTAAEASD